MKIMDNQLNWGSLDYAKFYVERLEFALVPNKPGTKKPRIKAWQKNPITSPQAAFSHWQKLPDDGMGAHLGKSRLATFDGDALEESHMALKAVGVNFDELLNASDAVQIEGNPKRAKLLYRWPEDFEPAQTKYVLAWAPLKVFELRTGPNQDMLPPSMHPIGKPYQWLTPIPNCRDEIPYLPKPLRELWENWAEKRATMLKACPWWEELEKTAKVTNEVWSGTKQSSHSGSGEGWDAIRAQIREKLPLPEWLDKIGASYVGANKFHCPFHTPDNNPSFAVFQADEGHLMWVDFHGDAPVGISTSNGYTVGDVIDIHAYHHNLTVGQATAAAAKELGIPLPKETKMGDKSEKKTSTNQQTESSNQSPPNGNEGASQSDGGDYYPRTDYGNAQRFASRHRQNLRHIDDFGKWFIWDGKRWKRDNTKGVVRRAKETVRAMYSEASKITDDDERKAFVKWARGSESKTRLEAMVELAKSEPEIAITPDVLDADLMLLNVANSTIDLRTGELRKHQRENLITKLSPVNYHPDAECPLWLSFLKRIMNSNANLIRFLQRAVGYSLTNETSEHCLFFMYGSGRNGKSTFVETLRALFGDYAQKAPTEMLMRKKYEGGIPNDIARLPGARLVVVAEVEEGRRLSESTVKDLTGGDTLTARFLRQEFFDFEPTHKIWMYGNHKPIIRGTDEAIWSRIPLIPFTVFIPPEERDPDLRKKLQAELPGILRWAIEGCLEWQEQGLDFPDEVIEATQEYRDEMDVLADFLDDCCVIHENAWVESADLWNAYQEWTKENGEQYPLGRRAFANRLSARGFVNEVMKSGGKSKRGWQGVGLAVEPKTEYEEGII